jgi:hypothetical protein
MAKIKRGSARTAAQKAAQKKAAVASAAKRRGKGKKVLSTAKVASRKTNVRAGTSYDVAKRKRRDKAIRFALSLMRMR